MRKSCLRTMRIRQLFFTVLVLSRIWEDKDGKIL